ncbi:magnesium transporter CorA family protein [Latilactobacillus sakei]
MIAYYEMTPDGQLKQGFSEKNADWVHFETPTKHEMHHFAKKYHLPTMLFEVAQDIDEVARYETFTTDTGEQLTHICLLVPVKTQDSESHTEYITRPFSMIVNQDKILTVGHQQEDFFNTVLKMKWPDTKIGTVVLKSISMIYHQYLLALGIVKQQINQLEENVHFSMRNQFLYALKALKKSVVYLDLGLKSNQQIFPQLEKSPLFDEVPEEATLLYRINLQFAKSDKAITTYKELLEQLSDLLSDIISNRLNLIMKTLTSISIVLTIPTIIGGFWGMNVPVPLANSNKGFLLLLGLSGIVSGLVGWWLKKKDYF